MSGVTGALVEVFDETRIDGWVSAAPDAGPVPVALVVDGSEVASTWAGEPAARTADGAALGFGFELRDLWGFVGPQNRISVEVAGRSVPIAGAGTYFVPGRAGEATVQELRDRLAAGEVFTGSGQLRLSKIVDADWQAAVLDLYGRLRESVRECAGADLFLAYGTLLGAVREQDFISADLDFDCAFVSTHRDGPAAAEALQRLGFALIDRGYAVHADPAFLRVRDPQHPGALVKIFHLFFDGPAGSGTLRFPFGVAGRTPLAEDTWRGVAVADFRGARVLLPAAAEPMLETVYGADWRESHPRFRWDAERVDRSDSGLLPAAVVEEIYWADFYSRTTYDRGSTFFDLVSGRDDLPGVVIDIGCGDGRDSFAFAGTGRTVTGLDRSHVGVRQAGRKAEQLGLADRLRFAACDVSDAEHLRTVLREARGSDPSAAVAFYARFFLHSIPADVQHTLLSVISESARPGDIFVAEFRTDRDETQTKIHGSHYRRFQNGAAFGRALRDDYRFTVVLEQEGNGMSPYKGEDPQLYRVLARREG